MMTESKKPVVEPIRPDEFRAMAEAVNKIQECTKAMFLAGLKPDAIVVLLHHRTKVPQRDIKLILFELKQFGDVWLTPEFQKLLREPKAK
jgi:hypothetical protein